MKIKFVALIAILACLLIVIPAGYAVNNDTLSDDGEVLQADYYFDAKIDNDTGTGAIDNPYKELTASRIESNSVLHLASGEYDLSNSKTVNNVTIIGENPTATIIKNAKFTVSSSLTLCNLTLLASPITNNGNLTATNMIFKDSTQYNGGAISSNSNSNVTLDNCTFINNGASFGGAIYCMEGWMYIQNSRFLNNTAEEFGGAILSISAETYIIGSKFKDNKANYYGGAIYTLYSPFGVMNSIFDNNSARDGGALLIDDASLCIIFSNEFSNNRADSVGALYSIANNVTGSLLNDNSFLNNSGSVANDVLESATPNMFISNGDYILAYYNPTFNGTIPSRYDLRELGYVTPVKNQGSSKCCWAFAAIASLESCILKATGISYDLSEDNVKNVMTMYSDYGWTYTVSTGGRDDMGMGYFIGWLGPVNESDDPFSASSFMSPLLNSFYHVQNLIFLQRNNYTDNDAIKKAIIEYGAVATAIYWSAGRYGSNGNYYYPGSEGANHAVTIVGWDDNYSKSNFKNTPEGDGAWIVKNSHGTSNGKGGYWYVSYYDTRCAQVGSYDVSYTFILNDTIKYDKNYQYDIPGRTDIFVNSSSTVWYKNRFTATDNEYLAAVSTYFDKLSNYTIYIYVNNALKHVQSGISNAGYYTFDLNKFVPLSIGDIFEVVFKVSVDGEAYFPVSEPAVLNKVLFSANTSFVSYDGENWTDLFNLTWRYSTHNYNSSVACIKAFTVYDVINTTTELSVGLTDSYNIKASVLNQYNRPVTGGTVTFNIDGKNCDVDVVNGKAIISLPADSEVHNVTAEYNNVGYISSADNLTFPSSLMATNISLTLSGEYNPLSITAVVLDSKGSVVEIGNVTFTVDGIP
ncbi:C1 family peptidase, partial [Methanobrevibacter sp.]|uniref:C1 family peptidase n=1 Tax=Methanobrevibacter sp. TaxID=66852 RepID=UPI00386E79D5